jgi:hypothetical protein
VQLAEGGDCDWEGLDGLDNMSKLTYTEGMESVDKPLVWLHGQIKTPPFSQAGRLKAGFLLRALQRGEYSGNATFETHASNRAQLP